MQSTTARRWLAGPVAVGALIAATATPSLAQTPDLAPTLGVYLADTTVAAGSAGKVEHPIMYATGPLTLTAAIITVDFTDLAGIAEVAEDAGERQLCTSPSSGHLTCALPGATTVDKDGAASAVGLAVKADPAAAEGASGTLTLSFRADGHRAVSHSATVRVGEGVDLAAGPATPLDGKPGGTVTGPLELRNAGDTVAKGAVAVFFTDYGIRAGKKYSNCTYEGDEPRTCRFDQAFRAGGRYSAGLPYRIAADAAAPSRAVGDVVWMTPSEYQDFLAYLDKLGGSPGKPGTAGRLTLVQQQADTPDPAGAAAAGRVQAETEPTDNWTTMTVMVGGRNGADLAAVGDTLTGKAGDVVTATVGVTNKGPATLNSGRAEELLIRADVRVPAGTTAVTVPDTCVPLVGNAADQQHPGKAGAAAYRCSAPRLVPVGQTYTVDLKLRIDSVTAGATGTATVVTTCGACEWITSDLNAANNVAKIVVNPAAGGGQGGGLPISGPHTMSLLGTGLALLLAGAFLLLVTRRPVQNLQG